MLTFLETAATFAAEAALTVVLTAAGCLGVTLLLAWIVCRGMASGYRNAQTLGTRIN